MHRDLKPGKLQFKLVLFKKSIENILLANTNDIKSVKIADFGLSFKF